MFENHLTNLTANMFQGLSRLAVLSLSNNRISHVSPEAFQCLVSIRSLDLGSNQLHQITDLAPVFSLPALDQLILGYNKFTSFCSDDLPVNVSTLSLLALDLNPLRKFSITKDVFPYLQLLDLRKVSSDIEWGVANATFLRNLTELALSGTSVSFEAYTAMLQTVDSLQTLKLSFMRSWVDEGLIDVACQTPSLRTLDVEFSQIGAVDDDLLRSCSQLTELCLSMNDLYELSEHSLRSTTRLRSLSLSNNRLSQLPLALRGLSALETLDLHSNLIMELDCEGLLGLTRLTRLYLGRNHISKLQECVFQNLNNLKVLNIEENSVFILDNTFTANLLKLESLNLHNNDLSRLTQGNFRNLSSLGSLDLESNTMYSLDFGAFEGLDNLKTLSVSLSLCIEQYFRGLRRLENMTLHLYDNWNPKSSQPNNEAPFSHLPHLKKLVFRVFNKFFSSSVTLKGLKSLEHFETQNFVIETWHRDTFKHTPRLNVLHITHGQLSNLNPELFWPIPNLQTLDLSNNKVQSLDFLSRANLTALRWLKLSENALSVINETIFQSLPSLSYLDLTGNPFTCDCSNLGLQQWILNNTQTQVVNGHQYTCAFPESQKGRRFLDFDVQSCWIDVGFTCFISCSSLVLLTLLASFVYHFLRWHLAYAYYLLMAFVYDKTRQNKGGPYRYDAFVSYNFHDEDWVSRKMLPVLEGEQGWRLCLHHRDFEPGKSIVENITEAIYSSRKTICVISRHYLQSEWCSREIQMASFRLFDEQKDVLVLLFMEDIPAYQLSPYYRMRSLVKRRTYLSWAQAGRHTGAFWQNIRKALEAAESPTEPTELLDGRFD